MFRRRLLASLGLAPLLGPAGVLAQPAAPARSSPVAPGGPPRRVALVIGNGRYPELPLSNPEQDARLVARTLRALDFDVAEHLNVDARDFRRVVREFARRLDDDGVASVFYYAGHGVQIDGRNYLLPADIAPRDEAEVRDESVDLQDALLARIDRVRPRARIFIIDACRNDPFGKRRRSASRAVNGLAEMAAPGALIAFSAAPGGVAEDGPVGGHSVYTRHLAEQMQQPGVDVEEMLKAVRIKVLAETQQRQIPWVNTSMVVNFAFNPGSAPAAIAAAPRPLRLLLQAQRRLNTDAHDGSASLALRVYVLRDAARFQAASFDHLYDDDAATLGPSLIARESLFLRPGESRELALQLAGEAQAIAVFGAYRELAQSRWRVVLPLPAGPLAPLARVEAQARELSVDWAR